MIKDGVFLGDFNLSAVTENAFVWVFESDSDFLWDDCGSCKDGQIVKDGFSVVTKWWGLDSADLETSLNLVDNQVGQWFAFDIIGDDQQGSLFFQGNFQELKDVLEWWDLVFGDQDQWLLEIDLLRLLVVNEVWWNVSSVELESLNEFDFVLEGFALANGDNTCMADFFEKISEFLTDLFIAIGWDGGDALDLWAVFDLNWVFGDFLNDCRHSEIDTLFHFAEVDASFDFF